LTPVNPIACPQCGEPALPHRVCGHCGTYRGRQLAEVEE
jgi:large subunit ribosomal protein L32